jgi:hypothetical protein
MRYRLRAHIGQAPLNLREDILAVSSKSEVYLDGVDGSVVSLGREIHKILSVRLSGPWRDRISRTVAALTLMSTLVSLA